MKRFFVNSFLLNRLSKPPAYTYSIKSVSTCRQCQTPTDISCRNLAELRYMRGHFLIDLCVVKARIYQLCIARCDLITCLGPICLYLYNKYLEAEV